MTNDENTMITSTLIESDKVFTTSTINATDVNLSTGTTVFNTTPKQVKGGVFAAADIELIKRALDVYKTSLVLTEESEREPSQELIQLANLLHRLNNRI